MIHKLSLMLTGLLSEQKEYPDEVYVYGMELFISTFISTMLIIVLSLIYGSFFEGVVYLISLTIIRLFAGGHHADTYLQCNILSVLSFYMSLIAYRYLVFNFTAALPYVATISAVFVTATVLLFAPVDNKYKPIQKEDRPKFKTKALITVGIVFASVFPLYFIMGQRIVFIAVAAMVVEAISIVIATILKRGGEG